MSEDEAEYEVGMCISLCLLLAIKRIQSIYLALKSSNREKRQLGYVAALIRDQMVANAPPEFRSEGGRQS